MAMITLRITAMSNERLTSGLHHKFNNLSSPIFNKILN